MILMYALRILVDVSFYLTFAMPVCVHYAGGGGCLLALIPALIYVCWLVFKRRFTLSLDRQRRVFSAYSKAAPVYLGVLIIGRSVDMAMSAIPWVILTFALSILLMRSLRHDSAVFAQRKYQLFNLLSLAVVLGISCLVSSQVFLSSIQFLLGAIYQNLILPVLLLLVRLLELGVSAIATLFSGNRILDQGDEVGDMVSGAFESQMDLELLEGATQENGYILTILVALVAVVALVFFFRWLGTRRGETTRPWNMGEQILPIDGVATGTTHHESVSKRSVRGIYRKFLKLCKKKGVEIRRQDTSLDVEQKATAYLGKTETVSEIRDIYVRHRYGGKIEEDDRRKMRQLYDDIKKNSV